MRRELEIELTPPNCRRMIRFLKVHNKGVPAKIFEVAQQDAVSDEYGPNKDLIQQMLDSDFDFACKQNKEHMECLQVAARLAKKELRWYSRSWNKTDRNFIKQFPDIKMSGTPAMADFKEAIIISRYNEIPLFWPAVRIATDMTTYIETRLREVASDDYLTDNADTINNMTLAQLEVYFNILGVE